METYIKGTFKRSIFSSNDGYKVGLIKIKETDDQDLQDYVGKQFTFTGLFAELNIDEDYLFKGNTVDNEKYGIQYRVNSYEKIMPEDKDGLVIFLSSDIFPGIGEKTAKEIVNVLGEDALRLINDGYECLLMVPKITEKKAIDIRNRLLKYNESYETVVYLTNFGFGMKEALKIYNHYKDDTIRVVESNPYELIDTIDGITFNKIDSLRSKVGIEINDERRIFALIIHIISSLCFQLGDTYLNIDTIYNAISSIYEDSISMETLSFYLSELNSLGKIIIKHDKYMLTEYYNNENYIAQKAFDLENKENTIIDNIENKI